MNMLTKAAIVVIAIKTISYMHRDGGYRLGGYDTTKELTQIWGRRAIYTMIPGLGLCKAVLDSAKTIAKNNSIGKGVNRHGR